MNDELSTATQALTRLQDFAPSTLVRENDFGTQLNFVNAVKPAQRIIEVAKRLPPAVLSDLTSSQLRQISASCNGVYSLFESCLKFSAQDESNPALRRDEIIAQIETEYDPFFSAIFPYIAYGVSQKTDFDRIEREARSTLQTIRDESSNLQQAINDQAEESR
jgi:hypothetical protein